ncbi:hypothetical protein [Methanobacterium sp.]
MFIFIWSAFSNPLIVNPPSDVKVSALKSLSVVILPVMDVSSANISPLT